MADVSLMLRNCRTFNAPDTEYVACANKLELFAKARAAALQTIGSGGGGGSSAGAASSSSGGGGGGGGGSAASSSA